MHTTLAGLLKSKGLNISKIFYKEKEVKNDKPQKPVFHAPVVNAAELPGSVLMRRLSTAENSIDLSNPESVQAAKTEYSSIFHAAREYKLNKVQMEVSDALSRLASGNIKNWPTANPVQALNPEPSPILKPNIQRDRTSMITAMETARKEHLIKEYCRITKTQSWPAGMNLSVIELRARVKSARKAVAKTGGGKKRGLCGSKQKKAKASSK